MCYDELDKLYGGNSLIKATLESSCHSTGGNSTAEEIGRKPGNKQSLLGDVVRRAESLGTWIEIKPLIGKMIGNGQENDVFIAKDGVSVINKRTMKIYKPIIIFLVSLMSVTTMAAEKRALVFGLGKQMDTKWSKINGDKDVDYVCTYLKKNGYTDITTLVNEQCTKQGMVNSFNKFIAKLKNGDEVYIHYSGHGQLMTDLNGDEMLRNTGSHSQWDESWVPYDAYMTFCDKDHGEKHFSDDEVAFYLTKVREKIGMVGKMYVVIDACHSGESTRAASDVAKKKKKKKKAAVESVRGVSTRFAIPKNYVVNTGITEYEEQWLTVSACKPYQVSTELADKKVGKLTYAIYSIGKKFFAMDNVNLENYLTNFMNKHKGRFTQTPVVSGSK